MLGRKSGLPWRSTRLGSPPAQSDAGFTLIEAIISLALFALIGMAGVGLITSILNVKARTEGRLEELGRMQRAVAIVSQDVEQLSAGPSLEPDGALALSRPTEAGVVRIHYRLTADRLERVIGEGENARIQPLLDGVSAVRWTATDGHPLVAPDPATTVAEPDRPAALVLTLTLDGKNNGRSAGDLRRVMRVPAAP